MSSITDFNAAAASADTLNVTAAVAAISITAVDVTGVVTGDTGTLTAATDASGILTLTGLAADIAAVDTIAEWVAVALLTSSDGIANVLAFEYDGNTYVYEGATGNTEVLTVELTGLTGVTAVATAAGANTILIA